MNKESLSLIESSREVEDSCQMMLTHRGVTPSDCVPLWRLCRFEDTIAAELRRVEHRTAAQKISLLSREHKETVREFLDFSKYSNSWKSFFFLHDSLATGDPDILFAFNFCKNVVKREKFFSKKYEFVLVEDDDEKRYTLVSESRLNQTVTGPFHFPIILSWTTLIEITDQPWLTMILMKLSTNLNEINEPSFLSAGNE